MGFSRQEYWSGLPFPSPGDLPDPGIDPRSPVLQADALTSESDSGSVKKHPPHSLESSGAGILAIMSFSVEELLLTCSSNCLS